MVVRYHVDGYENFLKFIESLSLKGPIYVLYSGKKLSDGKSWCPDCVEAEPYIDKGLQIAPEGTHLIEVEVGDRSFWKDLNCPFRTNPTIKLRVLPTLVRWGTQKRLEGDQLLNVDLIEMLVTDEDD